jgi:hypothetical protein
MQCEVRDQRWVQCIISQSIGDVKMVRGNINARASTGRAASYVPQAADNLCMQIRVPLPVSSQLVICLTIRHLLCFLPVLSLPCRPTNT